MLFLFLKISLSKVTLGLNDERQFVDWMRVNNQFYIGSEYHLRLGIFLTNLRYIQGHNNQKGIRYRLGVNKFACYTPSEYKLLLGAVVSNIKDTKSITVPNSKSTVPDSYDWRDHGVVNPVKNQGQCGSCWAFSTIASSESAYAIKTGSLLSFSEQNIIDCATNCNGCNGGWPFNAFTFILENQNGHFISESDYPYIGVADSCHFDESKVVGEITQRVKVEFDNEIDLKEKIATVGVASVCISANNAQFMSYTSGILDDTLCNQIILDHAVAVVGYGSENSVDYWIVRNSWGEDWGEGGYIRMSRNKNNQCGIARRAYIAAD